MIKMKLLTMFLVLILTGCFEVGSPILIQDNMANRYASTALGELSRISRGDISIESVDWHCAYLEIKDFSREVISEDYEYQLQVCYYFVEYLAGSNNLTKYARLISGRGHSVGTVIFDNVDVKLFETSMDLDNSYMETPDEISSEFGNFKRANSIGYEYGKSMREWG